MAEYTTQLKTIYESGYRLDSLDHYPIYDENFRPVLNQMILDKYWFREIGLETPELFNWFLRVKLGEIMPLYNRLYLSELLIIDPLDNYRQTESSKRSLAATGSTNTANNQLQAVKNKQADINKQVFSDTPQSAIDINFDSGAYATTLTKDENSKEQTASTDTKGTGSATLVNNTVDEYTRTVSGFINQNQADALIKYRSTLLKVTQLLLRDLSDLFMGVW